MANLRYRLSGVENKGRDFAVIRRACEFLRGHQASVMVERWE
jgi:hypothetical protein